MADEVYTLKKKIEAQPERRTVEVKVLMGDEVSVEVQQLSCRKLKF